MEHPAVHWFLSAWSRLWDERIANEEREYVHSPVRRADGPEARRRHRAWRHLRRAIKCFEAHEWCIEDAPFTVDTFTLAPAEVPAPARDEPSLIEPRPTCCVVCSRPVLGYATCGLAACVAELVTRQLRACRSPR